MEMMKKDLGTQRKRENTIKNRSGTITKRSKEIEVQEKSIMKEKGQGLDKDQEKKPT